MGLTFLDLFAYLGLLRLGYRNWRLGPRNLDMLHRVVSNYFMGFERFQDGSNLRVEQT